MHINCDQKYWTDSFTETAQSIREFLPEVIEGREILGPSGRDASLLIAQLAVSNLIHEALKPGETSSSDLSLIKKSILLASSSQLDKRTPTYLEISKQLATFHFTDQIPLHFFRKILGIATGLAHKDNDLFVTGLLRKLNTLKISINKILTAPPSSPSEPQIELDFDEDDSAPIRTRKSNIKDK